MVKKIKNDEGYTAFCGTFDWMEITAKIVDSREKLKIWAK